MPVKRFFLPATFRKGDQAILEEGEHHHLAHVLKLKIEDECTLINGSGDLYICKVMRTTKKQSELFVLEDIHKEQEPFKIHLYQAALSTQKLDWLLEKGVELGASTICFFLGEKGEKKKGLTSLTKRFSQIAIAALKQSGRLYLPKIEIFESIDEIKNPPSPIYYGGFSSEAKPLSDLLNDQTNCSFFIGPTSGFSPREIEILKKRGGIEVTLNKNTLRSETAALSGLSILSHHFQFLAR